MTNPLWQRSKTDDDLPEVQKEDKQETKEIEEERSVVSSPHPPLEGEIEEDEWQVKMVDQVSDHVAFQVYCKGKDREWYTMEVRTAKSVFKKVGI
jgi:hypothetical protein